MVARALFAVILAASMSGASAAGLDEGATIDCVFKVQHAMLIQNGQIKPTKDDSRDLITTFTGFKPNGRALLVGNAGTADVFYDVSDNVIVISQLFGSPIKTTTTFVIPRPGQANQGAHSRHVWFPGTGNALISQWGGPCRLR
jgi:hypothetical protein